MVNGKQTVFGLDIKTQVLIGLLVMFLISSVSLWMAYSRGARSSQWTPVSGEIVSGVYAKSRRIDWHNVKVKYLFDGEQYRRRVHRFGQRRNSKAGDQITVYVNPDSPTELASEKGFLAIDYGMPLTATLLALAGAIVTICVIYSPKDDYESDVNDSLI